jgi:hypothetical protein
MGNRKKLPHHEELTRLRVMTENQFTEKKLLRLTNIGEQAFGDCQSLTAAYFRGNAPNANSSVFDFEPATVYFLSGSTGWDSTFGGVGTELWNPLIQASGGSFGLQNNGFGFNVSGPSKMLIVVETCTNLANSVWSPLRTNALVNGAFYFSEPFQTNNQGRFYRICAP